MKTFLILMSIIFIPYAQACSEAGPHDFDLSEKIQKACGKMAIQYAKSVANAMLSLEKNQNKGEDPTGNFKLTKSGATLYKTQKMSESSKFIGFNVGFISKNNWQCDFCVDLNLSDDGNCRIGSISKHMCAK